MNEGPMKIFLREIAESGMPTTLDLHRPAVAIWSLRGGKGTKGMLRRLREILVGLAIGVWPFAVIAADDKPLPYEPDAIPRAQYMKLDSEAMMMPSDPNKSKEYFLAIYSGSTRGTYFYIASALCKAIEASYAQHRIHCVPLRSQGVSSNVELMNQGRAQFIIVQSDTNYYANQGKIHLPGGRSVMSLHDELGLMVVRSDSGIEKPADLLGKRINLGPEGTASRALWDEYLDSQGFKPSDFEQVFSVSQDVNQQGLCGGFIDAYGLWIGHPTLSIEKAIEDCGARVVGMWSPETAKLLEKHDFFFREEIPAGTYVGQDSPIESYGFKASLVAYQKADPYIVYWAVRSVRENLAMLREQHPALASAEAMDMFEKGNFLPFHAGAAKYWREIGWLSDAPIN